MGFLDFLKSDRSMENLSEIFSAAIVLSDKKNYSFPALNYAGEFELFIFNVALGWDILLENRKVNPTDSIIEKKIIFILERAKKLQLNISNNEVYLLYQKRYSDYKHLLDSGEINKQFGRLFLLRYLYSALYVNSLSQNIDTKSPIQIIDENEEYNKFSNDFLNYYDSAYKLIKSRIK